MKSKLYRKWLNYAMKNWFERKDFQNYLSQKSATLSYYANSVNRNAKYYDLNLYRLQVGFECWKNHDNCEDIKNFKNKYRKYSRKYWTDESKLRRMIIIGKELD